MPTLEERVEELERRLALIEARTPPPPPTPTQPAPPPNAPALVAVTISNKRYEAANAEVEIYEAHIWFDCAYTLSKAAKETRALKGVLEFADLFGEVKFRLNVTLNEPLTPGKPHVQAGVGFVFNQFLDEHKWMLATNLADMRYSFEVLNAIYSDGSMHSQT